MQKYKNPLYKKNPHYIPYKNTFHKTQHTNYQQFKEKREFLKKSPLNMLLYFCTVIRKQT